MNIISLVQYEMSLKKMLISYWTRLILDCVTVMSYYHLNSDSHGGAMAMSDAERQRKRRAKLKSEAQKNLLVRGDGGEFDERIRVALSIQKLAREGKITKEFINLIVETSETVFPTTELSTRLYIKKIVSKYLTDEN